MSGHSHHVKRDLCKPFLGKQGGVRRSRRGMSTPAIMGRREEEGRRSRRSLAVGRKKEEQDREEWNNMLEKLRSKSLDTDVFAGSI